MCVDKRKRRPMRRRTRCVTSTRDTRDGGRWNRERGGERAGPVKWSVSSAVTGCSAHGTSHACALSSSLFTLYVAVYMARDEPQRRVDNFARELSFSYSLSRSRGVTAGVRGRAEAYRVPSSLLHPTRLRECTKTHTETNVRAPKQPGRKQSRQPLTPAELRGGQRQRSVPVHASRGAA